MTDKLDRFLQYFSQKERDNIVELCKRISRLDAKVYMLMARKAACFFDCLRSLDVFIPTGYVTTERVLDMNTSWLINSANVCIIDDTIISGTTVFRTIERLRSIGIREASLYALSVNSPWFDFSLIDTPEFPLKRPYIEQEDGECTKQCKDIVSALSIFPRPYDVDFPYSANIKTKHNDGNKILMNPYWEVYEVTSPLQEECGIRSLVLLPTGGMCSEFDNFFNGTSWYRHFKIRLYCTLSEDRKAIRTIRVVPVTILKNLVADDCDEAFEQTVNSLQCEETQKSALIDQFVSTSSRYRFLQFFLSKQVGILWAEQCSNLLGYKVLFETNNQALELIFSPSVCPFINKVSLSEGGLPGIKPYKAKLVVGPADYPPKVSAGVNSTTLVDNMLHPFSWLYHNREIPARRWVKDNGVRNVKDLPYPLRERLFLGFTFDELAENCAVNQEGIHKEAFASLFLDTAIDEGIVVPLCGSTEEGVYFRGFRHGEDVVFGEEEYKMLFLLYQSYLAETKETHIPNYLVHKLAVVLFQTGTIFSRPSLLRTLRTQRQWTEAKRKIPNLIVARTKFYLQGPIIVMEHEVPNPDFDRCYLSTNSHASWLNLESIRPDVGILRQEEHKGPYFLNKCPEIDLPSEKERFATSLGSLLGHLSSTKAADGKPILNANKDIVTLTIGLDIRCALAALAADAAIVSERWEKDFTPLVSSLKLLKPSALSEEAIEEFRKTYTWSAVNAAREKFYIVLTEKARQLVDRIRKNLNARDLALWDRYWKIDEIVRSTNCDPQYWDAYENLGFWAISLKGYFSVLFLCSELMRTPRKQRNVSKYLKEVKDCEYLLIKFRYRLGKALSILSDASKMGSGQLGFDPQVLLHLTGEILPHMRRWVRPWTERADYLVQDFGKAPSAAEHYTYALLLTMETASEFIDIDLCKKQLSSSISKFILSTKRDCVVKMLPERLVPEPFDLMIIFTGGRDNECMASMINRLFEKVGSGFTLRCLGLAQLPVSDRIFSKSDGTDSYWMDGFLENLGDCVGAIAYKTSSYPIHLCYPKNEIARSEFGKLLATSEKYTLKQTLEITATPLRPDPYTIELIMVQRKEIQTMIDKSTNINAPIINSAFAANSSNVNQKVTLNPKLDRILSEICDVAATNEGITKSQYLAIQKDISVLRNELRMPKPSRSIVDSVLGRLGSIASIAGLVNTMAPFLPALV
jgi:hypothetical protein